MKRMVATAVLATGLVTGAANATLSLLIVAADNDLPVAQLSGGAFSTVDTFDAINGTPLLGLLQNYDVVLAYSNFVPNNPSALGDVLADYVDAGGGLVIGTYGMSLPWAITGRIQTPGYNPFIINVNGDVSGDFNPILGGDAVFNTPHVITPGDMTYFHNGNFAHPTLDGGATLLADDGAGIGLFALNASGRVGGLNMFPGVIPGNNDHYYDFVENALVRVVPTPGALAIFAVAGLGLRRRRR